MKIVNPIYDVAFKYLMEDEEIARGILSAIVGEEIVHLQLLPQESISESTATELRVLRFDFKAEIKLKDNSTKKILIELQKAKRFFDIMRFRRYLGENYRTPDQKEKESDEKNTIPLPIITIYFLGFELGGIDAPIVHVARQYQNLITGKKIAKKVDFIELLTHDSFVIQIPLLRTEVQTAVEEILHIFNLHHASQNQKVLEYKGKSQNPIVKKMIKRLSRAMSEEDIRRQMDFEDEIEHVLKRELEKELEETNKKIKALEQKAEEERLKAEEERLKAEEERLKAEEERLKNEVLLRKIKELEQLLHKKD